MIKVDVISGFLGAGKTTFIKKLLSSNLNEKVVLIENEFGEIGVDGAFLENSGIKIEEINQGCICCSLVGDFKTAINELIEKYNPERIIIEPSGVGKLSDVIKAITDCDNDDLMINSLVCVVDATKMRIYSKNFGEFFINQIENASTIITTRCDKISNEKLVETYHALKEMNPDAKIITTPLDLIDSKELLEIIENEDEFMQEVIEDSKHHHHDDDECSCGHHHHDDDEECSCGHHHDDEECTCGHHHHDDDEECTCGHHHHDDDEECSCGHHHHDDDEECSCGHHHHDDEECSCGHHHHHADEVFDSFGLETPKVFTKDKLNNILNAIANTDKYGTVIRCKGILASKEGWYHFDLVPEEYEIRIGNPSYIGKVCVIGSKLNKEMLNDLFLGDNDEL